MNLLVARNLIIQDRMDWRKPHLRWLPEALYRPFRALRR